MARTVACALVNSRIDYANSVLYGTSAANIVRLQRIQNALARVVTYKKRADHIRPVLENRGPGATGSRGSIDPHFFSYGVHIPRLTPHFLSR